MRAWVSTGCLVVFGAVMTIAGRAEAQDRAVIQLPVEGYAPPPPSPRGEPEVAARFEPPQEMSGSPVRLGVGPVAATTGRGLGPGLGVAAELGTGALGARLSAAWVHGEPSGADRSPIGQSLAQYVAEMTIDLASRGALHPILGLGFGYAHVASASGSGGLGVGTARLALEYALAVRDADVRLALGVLGALPGPADPPVADVRGWGLIGASVGIGF